MIDTHTHIDCSPLFEQIDRVLQRAQDVHISCMINVGVTIPSSQNSIALAHQHHTIFAAVGIHPDNIHELETQEGREQLETLWQQKKVVAMGEIGLDYSRLVPEDTVTKERQKKYFRWQLQQAKKYHLPVIIHSRNSADDTLQIIQEEQPRKAVMHCFAYDLDFAEKFLALNAQYMISFTGIVTFPNAKTTQRVVQQLPLEKMMVETDAPWLAPQIYRGQTNEPSYVIEVAKKIAELKRCPLTEIEKQLDKNTLSFFGLSI